MTVPSLSLLRLFGCVCALCHSNISASELIMKAKSQVCELPPSPSDILYVLGISFGVFPVFCL